MATITKGTTFASGDVVTPAKLNNLVDAATVSNIVTADIADGAVTQSKLNSSVTLVPTGAVMPFAMNSAPNGWLAANGAAVSRTTYAGLFTAIGTTYGTGDGSTTFNVPDLRGYFVRGAGTNANGTASGSFGAKQDSEFQSHAHTASTDTSGGHTHSFSGHVSATTFAFSGGGGDSAVGTPLKSASNTASSGSHSHIVTISATGGTETRPANIALLYCIKF